MSYYEAKAEAGDEWARERAQDSNEFVHIDTIGEYVIDGSLDEDVIQRAAVHLFKRVCKRHERHYGSLPTDIAALTRTIVILEQRGFTEELQLLRGIATELREAFDDR